MQLLSKAWIQTLLFRLLGIIILLKAASLLLVWFLPVDGVSMVQSSSAQPTYQRYSLSGMLEVSKGSAASSGGSAVSTATTQVSNLLLKGIYGSKSHGFAILAMKRSPEKTEVIGVSESFGGYKLVEIEPSAVKLERHGKIYTLMMEASGQLPAYTKVEPQSEGESAVKVVTRSEINFYRQNVEKIWQDIGITEVKRGKEISGFKVTRINPTSPFAKLGLKRGDVIVKANNKALTSYAAAMEIYRSIDKLQALELTITRNNLEKEIVYEIN